MRKLLLLTTACFLCASLSFAQNNGLVARFNFDGPFDIGDDINPEIQFEALSTSSQNTKILGSQDRFNVFGKATFLRNGTWLKMTDPDFLPAGNTPRTVSVWVKTTDEGNRSFWAWGNTNFVANTNLFYGLLLQTNNYNNYAWSNDMTTNGQGNANKWTHIVTTFDGTTRRIYVNGELKAFSNTTYNTQNQEFRIGFSHDNITNASGASIGNFHIDDLLIYNRDLSGADVLALYEEQRPVDDNSNQIYELTGRTTPDKLPNITYNQNRFTLEFDVTLFSAERYALIVGNRNSVNAVGVMVENVFPNGDVRLTYHWGADGWNWTGGPTIKLGQKYHIAMVVHPDSVQLFVDGVPSTRVATTAEQASLGTGALSGYFLGYDPFTTTNRQVFGTIDNIKFWKKSLSVDEVKENRFCKTNPNNDDLLAYFDFEKDETAPNIIKDLKGDFSFTANSPNKIFYETAPAQKLIETDITFDQATRTLEAVVKNNDFFYVWFFSETPSNNILDFMDFGSGSTLTPTDPGYYVLNVSYNFCTKYSEPFQLRQEQITSLFTSDFSKNISLFPNPAEGFFHVASQTPVSEVLILNQKGEVLSRVENQNHISTENLSTGLYFVRVKTTDEKVFSGKISVK